MLLKYVGGYEEIDISQSTGEFGAGSNLVSGQNCHEPSHFVALKPVVGAAGYVAERRPVGGAWTQVYEGQSTVFLDNTPGGKYEYRFKPIGDGGVEGQWSDPILYIVKPATMTISASKTCNNVLLTWSAVATEYIIYKDDVPIGYTTNTSWSGGVTQGGTFVFKVRGFVTPYVEGGKNCYVEAITVVSLLSPQPAGTFISQDCIAKNIIKVVADGNCGTTNEVVESFQCNGCFNPQIGLIGARSCSGNNVVQAAWSGTCDNQIVSQLIQTCAHGCLNGDCIQPFACENTNDGVAGLGLPSPASWQASYDLGNRTIDGICVNAWWVNKGNNVQFVEVYLNDKVVCVAVLNGDPTAKYVLRPGWLSTTYSGSGQKDPNSHTYTTWQGSIRVRVYADGTIGQGYGTVRLDAISWRNI